MPKALDIKDGILALKICLKKSWSRIATYWIEVWKVPLKTPDPLRFIYQWADVRSWKFTRHGTEIVEGSIPCSVGKSSFLLSLEQAIVSVDQQLERDYFVDTIYHNLDSFDVDNQYPEVLKQAKRWSNISNKPICMMYLDGSCDTVRPDGAVDLGKEKMTVVGEHSIPKVSSFKESQSRRAKKAKW